MALATAGVAPPFAVSDRPDQIVREQPMTNNTPTGTVFAVDRETRVIRGIAMPYGVEATKDGKRFTFSKGTIRWGDDVSRVKLWIGHEKAQAVGVAFELDDTDEGLVGAFKVARGAAGDNALTLAEDGVLDGLSIGPSDGARYRNHAGVFHSVDIPIHEVSLTPAPVFAGARTTSVSFDHKEGTTMPEQTTTDPAPVESTPTTEPATVFDVSSLTDAITAGFATIGAGPSYREVVVAGHAPLEVTEELPYRFDGIAGPHSLVDDMRNAQQGDAVARQRFETFVEETYAFAVTTGNAGALSPTRHRPELYVPQLAYSTPLWDSVTTGSIEDRTPFTVPKFSSASGLVGTHTEGVEPTPGAFAATAQTITPTALSGKVEINREVLDQGGSPQTDAIIWGEMLNGWFEARESRVASVLASTTTPELNLASATDSALVNAMTDYLAGLQFVRGGNRFTRLVADGMLFPKLVSAADSTGRKLLPVLGVTNGQGQSSPGFDAVQIGNLTARAAWALGATNASKSYSFVPTSVYAWASAPRQFRFDYQVKSIDMAIWGYAAGAVLRDSDVKPIDYTTADV